MRGYLKNEAANRKLRVQDRGWYDTGDVVEMTGDGFLKITGRLRRFAKVSGEMLSLTALEEALAGAFGERRETAVVAFPDPRRGERIELVSDNAVVTLEAARDILLRKGFSELALPRAVRYVPKIPKLATGKVDYVQLNALLRERAAEPVGA